MIKYSIVMRSVNANLFDINQAKSRIKAAEKAGQTPSSEDVALEGHRDRYEVNPQSWTQHLLFICEEEH